MFRYLRNGRTATISSACVRMKCRGTETEQAIREALECNAVNPEAISSREYAELVKDVELAKEGTWPKEVKQVEIAV